MRGAAMARIGKEARLGRAANTSDLTLLARSARYDPLSPEPFLARGVEANSAGDTRTAEAMFRAAERRAPRALPAHYFLAELLLTSGRTDEGAFQLMRFAQLSPGGITAAAPFLAAYAREPANRQLIRRLFRRFPRLGDDVLLALSSDAANKDAILDLSAQTTGPAPAWLAPLVQAMITAGDVSGAQQLWIARSPPGAGNGLLHDPDFRNERVTPPFGWALTQSALGLAERQAGGGLHVLFYGSQSGPLASQLLVLRPGRYRLAFRIAGNTPGDRPLEWTLTCSPNKPLGAIALRGPGRNAGDFTVPPDCPAQWLTLNGRIQDVSGRTDIVISDLALKSIGNVDG